MKKIIAVLFVLLLMCSCALAEGPAADSAQATVLAAEEKVPASMPILFLSGDPVLMTKYNGVVLKADFYNGAQEFHGFASVKWQGTSSLNYPKKNYNIKLYEDEALTIAAPIDVGWGEQSKYCLKANYMDHSHARNIVSARLWGDVVRSREGFASMPQQLQDAPNVGAVDGFPIKLYLNDGYEGLYTWNIPKDAWAFGMDASLDEHTVLCSENYGSGCFLQDAKIDGSDWSDEVHDVVPESILTRWNEVLEFVRHSTDADFVANIDTYIDKESLIDYYIFAYLSCGLDSMGKNQIYCTYDGSKWYASMYDMDSTWGLLWSGTSFVSPQYRCPEDYESNVGNNAGNYLYQRVSHLFIPEIKARYEELRAGALSNANILHRFEEFLADIPADLFAEDLMMYPDIPSADKNNIRQIRAYLKDRAAYVDFMIEHLGEKVTYVAAHYEEDRYSVNGMDEIGNYAFRLDRPLSRSSYLLDTGFKPFDAEKDWTIYCKFADSMVPEDGTCAVIFEMREFFPNEGEQTAVYLRRTMKEDGLAYEFAGGFGSFSFPFDRADGYKAPADGYHEVVIIKEGSNYEFYLDGGLAYNCALDYGVASVCMSDEPLYLFGRVENDTVLNRSFGEIADFRIYKGALDYEQLSDIDAFVTNGTDKHGDYILKTKAALTSEGREINTNFKPFDEEKDWTIFCKFSNDMVPMISGDSGTIFEMREYFKEDHKQTAVFLRKQIVDGFPVYSFAGGYGAFTFPLDHADGYYPSRDGYHYAVIMKDGAHYRFYLDGGLAYNHALDYGVDAAYLSDAPLYLFGRVEAGHAHNESLGEIADFRIYEGTMDATTMTNVLNEMKH